MEPWPPLVVAVGVETGTGVGSGAETGSGCCPRFGRELGLATALFALEKIQDLQDPKDQLKLPLPASGCYPELLPAPSSSWAELGRELPVLHVELNLVRTSWVGLVLECRLLGRELDDHRGGVGCWVGS